jgi:hypothetical protein
MDTTDMATNNPTKVIAFRCTPELFDAMHEFAIFEGVPIDVAARNIIENELRFLDYLPPPPLPVATDLDEDDTI